MLFILKNKLKGKKANNLTKNFKKFVKMHFLA